MRRSGAFIRSAALALAALLAAPAHAAGLTLFDGGETGYRISVAPDAPAVTQDAARELADYLGRISGAGFTVVEADAPLPGPEIRVVSEPARRELPGDGEGFHLFTRDDDLVIAGDSPRGAAYGVYYFLERFLGVHWLSSEFTVVPARERFMLDAIDLRSQPRFRYREVFSRDAEDAEFAFHNRLNGQFGHRIGHELGPEQGGSVDLHHTSIFGLVPPQKYGGTHPEFFAGGQLRFANPEMRRIALENLKQRIERKPEQPYFLLVEHADRETYYSGGRDGDLIRRAGAPGGAYFDFMRFLADGIREAYPHVTLLAQAYLWSREPPRGPALPENLGVMLSDIEVNFAQPLAAPDNRAFMADLAGWSELTDRIVVWHYITDFSSYLQPFPNLHVLGPDIKTLAGHESVIGLFAQGAYSSKGGALAALRAWVLSKLMWSPERDAEALIREFSEGYFGPAAPYILDYIAALERSARRTNAQLSTKTPPTADYLSLQFLRHADQLFAQAAAAVADRPAYLAHVQTARMAVDYAILINRQELKLQAQQSNQPWPRDPDRLQRLARAMAQAGVTHVREGGDSEPEALLRTLSIGRSVAATPDICAHRPGSACKTVQDQAFSLAAGAHLVSDSAASDGAAATLAGDAAAWGIQLPLKRLIPGRGEWRLYVRARVAPRDAGPRTAALQVGVHPGRNRTTPLERLADGRYHMVPVPGAWSRDDGGYLWVAPGSAKAVEAIYVDRIVAVPAED